MLFVIHRPVGIDTVALWDGRERKVLLQLEGLELWNPTYSSSGHVLYERVGSNPGIWAVPFSLENLDITGEPFLVVAEGGSPSVSRDGTLLYVPGGASRRRQMFWMDREGNALGDVWDPKDDLREPALSPDGRRVAVSIDEGGKQDIWVYDLVAEAGRRLTYLPGPESYPAWTPDGSRIAFGCTEGGLASICVKAADGTGETRTLVSEGDKPEFSRDGKTLVYESSGEGTGFDVWHRDLEGDAEPSALLQNPESELDPSISSDGRLLAYTSWAEGHDLFIIRFPEGAGKRHVGPGRAPRWSRTGYELFYVTEGDFMAVSVESVPSMSLGTPTKLFSAEWAWGYDVTPDGQRFLLVRDVGEIADPNLAVVQNWFAEFSAIPSAE
jgi:Tol biopolymer transport system component